MTIADQRTDGIQVSTAIAAVLIFVGAIAVRGVSGVGPIAPSDRERAPDELRAPMQFLGPGAQLRASELTPRVREVLRSEWSAVQPVVATLTGCPPTAEWLSTPAGQRFERLAAELRRGSREEALAALHLCFELARRSEWHPGLLARTQHADKLAGLLQEWLRAWGERSADDTLLSEPAVAATIAYGALMRRVSQPLPLGGSDEALARAQSFLRGLLLDSQGQATRLSIAIRARHPAALERFDAKRGQLEGFAEAFENSWPELDGECGE